MKHYSEISSAYYNKELCYQIVSEINQFHYPFVLYILSVVAIICLSIIRVGTNYRAMTRHNDINASFKAGKYPLPNNIILTTLVLPL